MKKYLQKKHEHYFGSQEAVKLKHDVVSLEKVSHLLLEIMEMKSCEDFVNKFIQDGKITEYIVAVVVEI